MTSNWKKIGLILIISLLILSTAGCTLPGVFSGKATPTPAVQPTDSTTPGVIVTQQPPVTVTPVTAANWLNGYTEKNVNREQYLPEKMKVTYDKLYYTDDWKMPFPLGGPKVQAANHGAIMKIKFYNPTSNSKTFLLDDDVKASFSYFDQNGVRHGLVTADVFYEPDTGKTTMETVVAPGQTKTVWILAYISYDSDYEKYGSRLDTPTLDANPHYAPI